MSHLSREAKIEMIRALPKVELHLHLDGSLSPEFMEREAKRSKLTLPVPANEIPKWIMDQKCQKANLNPDNRVGQGQNWDVFNFCNQFLQTEVAIADAVQDLLHRLHSEHNVVYAEIRFAPVLSTRGGLSVDQVVQAALIGFQSQSRVQGGIILCLMRSFPREHGVAMADLAQKHLQRDGSSPAGVIGVDVAGDEGSFPLHDTSHPMFQGVMRAKSYGIPITVHAGEWPDHKFKTMRNIEFAIDELGVARVGHGIALGRHPDFFDKFKRSQTTVEVCLTSNVGRGFKVDSFAAHPARLLAAQGIPFSLSCDNLLLSGDLELRPDPTTELLHLFEDVLVGDETSRWRVIRQSLLDGIRAGFSLSINEAFKRDFVAQIECVFKQFGLEV